MARGSIVLTRVSQAAIVSLVIINIYRACTQSITIDEAFTYNEHVSRRLLAIWTSYESNHHVLNTLLCKLSVTCFGVSEFTLRLPSVMAGALYLVTAFRLCHYVFGTGPEYICSLALLALNPFILDHLSAARGYGLGLAFLMWALYHMIRYLSEIPEVTGRVSLMSLYRSGLGIALAVSSNLAFLFPALALGAMLVILIGARELSVALDYFVVPAAVVACVILGLPLTRARLDHFYFGVSSLQQTFESIMSASLWHHPDVLQFPGVTLFTSHVLSVLGKVIGPLLVAVMLCSVVISCTIMRRVWKTRFSARGNGGDYLLLMCTGAMLLILMELVAVHHLFHIVYPVSRTAIYFIPFLVLIGCHVLHRIRPYRPIWLAGLAVASACVAQFVLEFNVNHYGEWRFDAGTKRVVSALQRIQPKGRSIKIRSSWELEPALNFYRRVYHIDSWQPVDRESPKLEADYRVLLPSDAQLIRDLGLQVLYRDHVSGAVLAK